MLAPILSTVPAINIEYCQDTHQQSSLPEPASPFDRISFAVQPPVDKQRPNGYRSHHLLPPPVLSPKDRMLLKKPQQSRIGTGLDPARFEALRRATAAKAPMPVQSIDLRKEVAVRAHNSKQIERRNLFLSKIEALPSPTATSLPVTPPESPAVFHFTLPSPGLISPLALFESLDDVLDSRPVRVEQVDFRARARKEAEALASLTGNMRQSLQVHGLATMAPHHQQPKQAKEELKSVQNQTLPSLDQISKRLGGNITISRSGAASPSRLPAFLQRSTNGVSNGRQSPVAVVVPAAAQQVTTTTSTPISTICLPSNTHGPIARPTSSTGTKPSNAVRPPVRPASVTLPGPHIASTRAPTPLTAAALNALADRAERGSVMMERLKRRFSAPAELCGGGQRQTPIARKIPGGF